MREKLAIYFHWPWCKSKCPYCDFFKRVEKNVDQRAVIDAYLRDLTYYHNLLPNREICSVFFGGGTPSLIAPQNIDALLARIAQLWPMTTKAEISLEANPNSEYPQMFQQLKNAGINRLSLGVQALNDADLRVLGRTHNLQQARHCIEQVVTTFDNHSMDLIYARPQQTLEAWLNELQTATNFGFKHLSLYQLTIEEGTPFAKKKLELPDEETAAEMYLQTNAFMEDAGYPFYEVSNYAPAAYESVHNKCYWLGTDYIGIGESAHGRLTLNGHFFATTHPRQMLELSPDERAEELLLTGLRLRQGINKALFRQICGFDLEKIIDTNALFSLVQQGLLADTGTHLRATFDGMLLLNRVVAELCV